MAFEVKLALLALLLFLLYAITFSYLVYVSLLEQVVHANLNLPRYATPPHAHNAVEWFLLLFPAISGWIGILASLLYLGRRLRG